MIVIVAGVSGSGKTTVGELLATRLRWPFVDGDTLHPAANVAKMASGVPLTDADRAPWLRAIGAWIDDQVAAGRPGLVACSALKRSYRAELLAGRPAVRMAFLLIDREVAARRLAARHGHFFAAGLLGSQFADLEPPSPDETNVVPIPVAGRPSDTADEIISHLGLAALAPGADRLDPPAVLARGDDRPEPGTEPCTKPRAEPCAGTIAAADPPGTTA
jgi:gluconokinase